MNEKNITDAEVVNLRNELTDIINAVKSYKQSRVTSLVITKLEEAQMWAGNLFSKDKTDGIIKR